MGASKRWNLGLMRWRSSLANSASAWRISKDCWKDCARPSPDGPRPARAASALGEKAEYVECRSDTHQRLPRPTISLDSDLRNYRTGVSRYVQRNGDGIWGREGSPQGERSGPRGGRRWLRRCWPSRSGPWRWSFAPTTRAPTSDQCSDPCRPSCSRNAVRGVLIRSGWRRRSSNKSWLRAWSIRPKRRRGRRCVESGQGGRRVLGAPPHVGQGAGRMASTPVLFILGLLKEELS